MGAPRLKRNKSSRTGAIIWGAGGHARVALDILQLQGVRVLGFIDDTGRQHAGESFCDLPVFRTLTAARAVNAGQMHVAIGDNAARHQRGEKAQKEGLDLISAVHPSAIIARDAQIGAGTLVAAGAVVNPGVNIGKSVIINTLACIEHNCVIQDGVHISPGARLAGWVRIDRLAWIGIGATVIDKLHIGEASVIGAGAVVIHDVAAKVVSVGVPARVIRPL